MHDAFLNKFLLLTTLIDVGTNAKKKRHRSSILLILFT